jgi:hypothetical protein
MASFMTLFRFIPALLLLCTRFTLGEVLTVAGKKLKLRKLKTKEDQDVSGWVASRLVLSSIYE